MNVNDDAAMAAERLQFAQALDEALGGSERVVGVFSDMLDSMTKGRYPSRAEIKQYRAACAAYLENLRSGRELICMQIEKAGTIHG
jgi:hypothetical protein